MRSLLPEVMAAAMVVVALLAHGAAFGETTVERLIMATAYMVAWTHRRWFADPQMPEPTAENDNRDIKPFIK
jgi:hypothetical protein